MSFNRPLSVASAALVGFCLGFSSTSALADESDAKRLLQHMSDYMAAKQSISFDYDATLEVVTTEDQKLGIAASGTVTLVRPDKINATRTGGFSDIELLFDGKTVTLIGKRVRVFTRLPVEGTIDDLVDVLREEYGRPLPAADLLMSNPYQALMSEVTDIKDLGSGFIRGHECDHLAFRTPDVDWQIWIAQGERPFPCRYVITTPGLSQGPQYTIEILDWRVGEVLQEEAFVFMAPDGATEVVFEEYESSVNELSGPYMKGGGQ